jgi:hypothetical protein
MQPSVSRDGDQAPNLEISPAPRCRSRRRARKAVRFGFSGLAGWLDEILGVEKPTKAHQDRLDSAICLLVAIRWRLGARDESVALGDLRTGYVVAPVSPAVMKKGFRRRSARGVNVDALLGTAADPAR